MRRFADADRGVAAERRAVHIPRYMNALPSPPHSGPPRRRPADPEHDPTASYALDRAYVAALTGAGRRDQRARPSRSCLADHRPAARRTSRSRPRPTWRRRSAGPAGPRRRGRAPRSTSAAALLLRLHDLVLDRQDEIIDLICWESGKARKHAFDEPLHIALTARYYARTAHEHLDTRRVARRRPRADPGRGQPGPQGRRRHHLAVELPLHDGAVRRAARRCWPATPSSPSPTPRPCSSALLGRSSCSRRPASRRTSGRSSPARAGSSAPRDHRPRRLHLLHRLDRDRQADRQAVRRPADRLLARARRQEPDPGPPRRRPREGRRGRRARRVLQRRPALRLDGADVRRRPGLRPVHARGSSPGPRR